MEPLSAALAARRRKPRDLRLLKACLKAMAEAEGDNHRFARADLAFHLAIGAVSGNPLIRAFNGVIAAALHGVIAMTAAGVKAVEKSHGGSIARHAAILAAIEARKPEAARRAMRRALESGRKYAGRRLKRGA